VKLKIGASKSTLTGERPFLDLVNAHFSYEDKAAASAYRRLKETLKFKEMSFHGDAPDWFGPWKEAQLKDAKAALHVYCCDFDGEDLLIPTGLVPSLVELSKVKGVSISIQDNRNFDVPRRALKGQSPPSLRKPQEGAIEAFLSEKEDFKKGLGLIKQATGSGKTLVAQMLIQTIGVRTVFLVPSVSILNQTVKRFELAFGKKNVKAYGGGKKDLGYITVATYQSVNLAEEGTFDEFDMVVGDECHKTGSETFHSAVCDKLKNAVYRLGLTAYEERADGGTMLVEAGCGPIIYEYNAPEAIADGYLARPTFMVYDVWSTQGAWTKYKMKDGKRTATGTEPCIEYDGDDDLKAYRNWMLGNNKVNSFIASVVESFVSNGKSILILVDEKDHAERLLKLMPDAGFAFGGGTDNEKLLKSFNKRELKVLIGTSTLGEGTDTVPVDVLFNLQGGASKSRTLQATGRALRNETDENGVAQKPTSLVIDFNFPLCKMLARHYLIREKIYKEMGEIIKGKLI
jgi:superfamily II DNA or RNA helicase